MCDTCVGSPNVLHIFFNGIKIESLFNCSLWMTLDVFLGVSVQELFQARAPGSLRRDEVEAYLSSCSYLLSYRRMLNAGRVFACLFQELEGPVWI